MKSACRMILFALLVPLCVATAQIPQKMNYQGVLTDTDGNKVEDGIYSLTFRMYTAPEASKAIWMETQEINIKDGLFNVILGELTPLTPGFDRPYWLGISINGATELSPRIELTASAYSLNAQSVSDSAITSSKIAAGAVTLKKINTEGATTGQVLTRTASGLDWQSPSGGLSGSGTGNYIPRFDGSTTLANSNIQYGSEHGSNIGIGISPNGGDSKLLVSHNVLKGVDSPTYLLRLQTQVSSGIPSTKAYIARDGKAFFDGSLQVGAGSISIAEIKQLTGVTSSSSFTNISLPSGWDWDNTRILSAEVNPDGNYWRPVSFGSFGDSFYYHLYPTHIRFYQDINHFIYKNYRFLVMRIEY